MAKTNDGVQEPQSLDEMERELKTLQLETARIQLAKTRKENAKYVQDELSAEEKFKRAQATLSEQVRNEKNTVDSCTHKQGGFGLEDLYNGDSPNSSLSIVELPIRGREMVICTRCLGTWQTPDPLLLKKNKGLYLEQMEEFKAIRAQARGSKSKPVGVPSFAFERDGVPVHPVIQ